MFTICTKRVNQQKNVSSNFGFIEETMELSCILLAVTLKPCCFCVKGGGGHGRNTIDACFRLTPIKSRRNWGWRGFNCTPRFCQVQNKNLFLQKLMCPSRFSYLPPALTESDCCLPHYTWPLLSL